MPSRKAIIKSSVTDCGMVQLWFNYGTLFDHCLGDAAMTREKAIDTLEAILDRAENVVANEDEGIITEERIDYYLLTDGQPPVRARKEKARTGESKKRPDLYIEAKEVWNDQRDPK